MMNSIYYETDTCFDTSVGDSVPDLVRDQIKGDSSDILIFEEQVVFGKYTEPLFNLFSTLIDFKGGFWHDMFRKV